MEVGKPEEGPAIVILPKEDPVPRYEPAPEPAPPEREPVEEPARV
jgi:hypothetical protein